MKLNSYAAHPQRSRWRENSLEGSDENETQKFNWHLTGRFRPYLARYKGATLASVVLMLLYTAFSLANPYLIGVAIDRFIGHNDLHGLAIISIILLVVNIFWRSQYWQVWYLSWAGQQILYHLSSDMFTHLQRLSLCLFNDAQIGRVMSRLQSDIDVLESDAEFGIALYARFARIPGRHHRSDAGDERIPGAAHLYRTAYHDSYRRFLAAVRTAFLPAYTRRHLTG